MFQPFFGYSLDFGKNKIIKAMVIETLQSLLIFKIKMYDTVFISTKLTKLINIKFTNYLDTSIILSEKK